MVGNVSAIYTSWVVQSPYPYIFLYCPFLHNQRHFLSLFSLTAFLRFLLTLKKGNFLGLTVTIPPFFGFLPLYDPYSLMEKLPKPLTSTPSPRASASDIDVKMVSTILVTSLTGRLSSTERVATKSALFVCPIFPPKW